MSTPSPVRHALIDARKSKQMTQQELADMIGITRSFLANLERGKYAPSLKVAFDLARVLERKVEQLFSDLTGESVSAVADEAKSTD